MYTRPKIEEKPFWNIITQPLHRGSQRAIITLERAELAIPKKCSDNTSLVTVQEAILYRYICCNC